MKQTKVSANLQQDFTSAEPKMAYYNGALPVDPLGGYICGITR